MKRSLALATFFGIGLILASGAPMFILSSARQLPSATPPQQSTLQFEAATIKPAQRDLSGAPTFVGGSCHGIDTQYPAGSAVAPPPLGRCVLRLTPLNFMLAVAYNATVTGGPAWTSSDRFDLEAKAEDPSTVTQAQLISMLQALLTSRFNLQFHREKRDVPAFVLYVAKNGLKVKEVTSDEPPRVRFGPGATVTAQHVTMEYFANSIRGMARGPVTDKTGLTGKYDFSFEWPTGEPDAFLSEMQAQLGLRVESTKVPMDFVVIDHADKPIENK